MICPPCATAGAATQSHDRKDIIEALHKRCRGGTWCDCQHGTQSALNQKLVKAAEVGIGAADE